jgi:hypothetical protein
MVEARPKMIAILDTFRDDLEDLGAGLGVTDPVSGEVVVKLAASKPATKKQRDGKTKTACSRSCKEGQQKFAPTIVRGSFSQVRFDGLVRCPVFDSK